MPETETVARVCGKCEAEVTQQVSFTELGGRIVVLFYRGYCPYCGGFLKEPRAEEVIKALSAQGPHVSETELRLTPEQLAIA
jgi:hypothetical protein